MTTTPLYEALSNYIARRRCSYHTPGHKGQAALLEPLGAAAFDLTELPDTGSLYDGGDAIEAAENAAAQAFGAGMTAFSGGGCTLCIQTMLALAAFHSPKRIENPPMGDDWSPRGNGVLMARNAHRSAVHAAALLGLSVSWLTDLSPRAVETALASDRTLRTVYVTSPDYYGRLADIAGMAAVCRRFGAALLVDNAHGSHLGAFGLHPLQLGADMTADSAHKTLPVLTGGAYLHIAGSGAFGGLSRTEVKRVMALFGSTSPAFPVLASLDLAQAWWQTEGREAFVRLAERIQPVKAAAKAAGLLPGFDGAADPVRLTLDCGARDAGAAADRLRERGIEPEYADSRYVVLLLSPFHTDEQLAALRRAVTALGDTPLPAAAPSPFSAGLPVKLPERVMSLRDALLAPCEEIAAEKAAGRISAGTVCPCPPGVAAVTGGERITAELAVSLAKAGFETLTVTAD